MGKAELKQLRDKLNDNSVEIRKLIKDRSEIIYSIRSEKNISGLMRGIFVGGLTGGGQLHSC